MQEFPKWVRWPGKKDMLVDNAEAEALQIEAWAAETPKPVSNVVNALIAPVATEDAPDTAQLRVAYKEKFGKKAFGGWDAAELAKRLEADA